MSKVKQLRHVHKQIEALRKAIARKEKQLEALQERGRNIGWFMTCCGSNCNHEVFIASKQNPPGNWWQDNEYDESGPSYKCPQCAEQSGIQSMRNYGWTRLGLGRRQKQRKKQQDALLRSQAYWDAEITFLDQKDFRVYQGTRLQMAGCVYGSGMPGYGGIPSELDIKRCAIDDTGRIEVDGHLYEIEPAPANWTYAGKRYLEYRGIKPE